LSTDRLLLIVLAHYNDSESVNAFLEHLGTVTTPSGWKLEVAVCDNSHSLELSGQSTIPVSVFLPPAPLHYLNGTWHALNRWRRKTGRSPDWTIVCNHDLVLDRSFFQVLLTETYPEEVALVAPDTTLPNGIRQNPHMKSRPGLLKILLLSLGYQFRLMYLLMLLQYRVRRKLVPFLRRRLRRSDDPGIPGDPVRIYAAHGSMFILRSTFFSKEGSLASGCTTYHEEILVAERIRRSGLTAIWHPALKVLHNEHSSMGSMPNSSKRVWMKNTGKRLMDVYSTGEIGNWTGDF